MKFVFLSLASKKKQNCMAFNCRNIEIPNPQRYKLLHHQRNENTTS